MTNRAVYIASTCLVCFILLRFENQGVDGLLSSTSTSSRQAASQTAETKSNGKITHRHVENKEDLATGSRFSTLAWVQARGRATRKRKCGLCPEDDENGNNNSLEEVIGNLVFSKQQESEASLVDESQVSDSSSHATLHRYISSRDVDRREAAFAMLGTIWATTTGVASFSLSLPQPALATFGNEAKIELPNVAQGLADRNSKQCLVESLGNRECLVYADPDNRLYQGLDSNKLLQKIAMSSEALAKIPSLVDEKKWSGVNSILTGPMGELLGVMNQLASLSTQDPQKSMVLAKQVKLQVFAISAAVGRKDGNGIRKTTEEASTALVAFVQSL